MGFENTMKKIVGQSCSILKATTENIKVLLDKLEWGRKDHGTKELKDDQGPNKRTRESSKKLWVMEDEEIDELRASTVNMNILADQATNLLKTF